MEQRTEKVDVRLTPQEKDALLLAAAKARRSTSDYARPKLLRGLKKPNGEPFAKDRRASEERRR